MKVKVLQPVIIKSGRIANTGDVVDTEEQGWKQSYVDHLCVLKRIEAVSGAAPEMVDKMAAAAPVDKLGKGRR